MPFEPDIIVTSRDAPNVGLVVELQMGTADLQVTEQQLKRYMFGMGCPVGLLVTPTVLRVYRDAYRQPGESSIDLVGEFPTPKPLSQEIGADTAASTRSATRFEEGAQAWLEQLSRGSGISELAQPLRGAIEEHVLPALAQGEIRAAGPRWRPTGS